MLCDLHVHTRHSYDSKAEMTAYCQRAIEIGLTHICFTDHIDMNPLDSGHEIYDLDAYFEEYFRIRERFCGKLTVLSGLEFAEPHIYRDLFEHMKDYPFDYILGSLHWIHGRFPSMFARSGWTKEQAYAYYWEEMGNMVTQGGFDAVAHFDLPKRYLKSTWYEPVQMRAILQTIVKNGLLLEINTSSLRAGASEGMPGSDLLQLYREAGGTHVMTGSDAHVYQDLGSGIFKAKQQLNDLGLSSGYFQNRSLIKEKA